MLYVSELIGPGVINTMPEHTLRAFADHGTVARTLDADPDAAERTLADAAAAGLDLAAVTARLEREGVRSFCDSYHQLLGCIERKIAAGPVTATPPRGPAMPSQPGGRGPTGNDRHPGPPPGDSARRHESASSFGAFLEVQGCG